MFSRDIAEQGFSALSYDWSKGHAGVPPAGVTKVMLHPVTKEEVQKKDKVMGR
jgi:hypothetical protein